MNTMEFLARLGHERERLDRLAQAIHRKRVALRDACTQLQLGVDAETVALCIVKVCRKDLAGLDARGAGMPSKSLDPVIEYLRTLSTERFTGSLRITFRQGGIRRVMREIEVSTDKET